MNSLKSHLLCRLINNQKGVSAILIAIVLPVLLGFTALAIDVGYMYATKNELQNIADGAALAGAGELGRIYQAMPYVAQQSYDVNSDGDSNGTTDITQIRNTVESVASKNNAAGKTISIDITKDVYIGVWDFTATDPAAALNVTTTSPDAVRVIARRDQAQNSPVTTFFARIFSIFGGNHDTFEASAVATAALSGMSIAEAGVLKAPFGISQNHPCDGGILKFYPTTDSCAGWHNFFDAPNSNTISDKFINIIEGFAKDGNPEGSNWIDDHFWGLSYNPTPETSPENSIGDSFDYNGGTINSLFASGEYYTTWTGKNSPSDFSKPNQIDNFPDLLPFKNLFDFFRFRDGDGSGTQTVNFCNQVPSPLADEVWTTTVPIYADNNDGTCKNPKGLLTTVGFAKVRIRMIPDPKFPTDPKKASVEVCYDCNEIIEAGRGGGGMFGNVKGSIPNLVE